MKCIKIMMAVMLGFFLSACAVHLPQKNLFTLNPGKVAIPHARFTPKTLLVMTTQASDPFDNAKMAYVNKPFQLAYFTKNAWASNPADELTSLITRALQKTQGFKAVMSVPFAGTTDLKLNTYLYKLQQNFLFRPSREQLLLSAQLVNANTGKAVAEKTFSYNIKTHSDNPYGGVVAANQAVKMLLQQLTRFVVHASR